MKAPEKVYIDDFGSGFSHGWHTEHSYERDIEYIRTDIFIEKVCEFIKERFSFEDSWHVEGETTILDKVIEDIKKYMEEQQ